MSKEVLLDVRHLTQQFHLTKKIKVKAVDDVSFQIHKGEIFGLVGESGSGKSTVARCLMNIYQPTQGEIWYKDVNICDKKEFRKNKKMLQTRCQMIFQDSASSLNQKMKVSDIITEPMRIDTPKDCPTHLLKNPEQYITKVGALKIGVICKNDK